MENDRRLILFSCVLAFLIFSFFSFSSKAANITSQVVITVLPSAPSNLTASASSQSQINLSWTDNSVNETGFQIGRKTGSDGNYSQIATTSADVASYSDNNLSASTAYFYRVRAYNADGSSDYSNEASSTTYSAPQSTGSSGGGGGGGGGGWYAPPVFETAAIFRGKAYPQSDVTLIKDGRVAASTKAGANADFEIKVSGLSAGVYAFGIWAEDRKGNKSLTHNFVISVTGGATTVVSGIFLAPTIDIDKSEIKKGDILNIFGYSAPEAVVSVLINSDEEILKKTNADKSGGWLLKFDTDEIDSGNHTVRAKAHYGDDISIFSQVVGFNIGNRNVAKPQKVKVKGDFTGDGKVGLTDFSILAYWYGKPNPLAKFDLNGDGKIDIVDFSIMAFYWTG